MKRKAGNSSEISGKLQTKSINVIKKILAFDKVQKRPKLAY